MLHIDWLIILIGTGFVLLGLGYSFRDRGWGVGMIAAGVLTIVPGALVIWFVRNYIAKGFALGRV